MSPSLGVVTCASHRSVLVGWGIERVVTTGSRRGSDDAIGAEVLPLCAGSVAAGVALAGAIAIGRREDASCMPHEACLAQTSLALHSCCCLGQWSGAVPLTNVGKPDCDRAAFALDCGGTMAGARCQDAVQTIDYRLTGISEPCGCRCRGDQSGSCARSREHRAMRLRASSGLTQPACKTIRGPTIRCTMAKRYSCALRESPDSRL